MLESLFSSTLDRYIKPNSQLVLALSGGVDSRVLLDVMARYAAKHKDIRCCAVHVHHGLSENANGWVSQCQTWCDDYGITLYIERVQLQLNNQVSIEQEAREKRYQALQKHVGAGDVLLTAQHSSDQLETFLLAMKRGSGPRGLSSMPECAPFADGLLIRPLLSASQDSIIDYAHYHQLSWVEDESNFDTRFDRNFLRHDVIPKLKSRWPSIEQAVIRTSKLCADQENLIEELLQAKLDNMVGRDGGISIDALSKESELARNQLIRFWLRSLQSLMPSSKQLELIWAEVALAAEDANPKLHIPSGDIRRFKNALYFIGRIADVKSWSAILPSDSSIELPDNIGKINFSTILNDSLSSTFGALRAPKEHEIVSVKFDPEGLIAHPSERMHSRKLKKLFQEYGVPSWLRTRTPIVMYGEEVAMVGDLFVCKDFIGRDCVIIWDKV